MQGETNREKGGRKGMLTGRLAEGSCEDDGALLSLAAVGPERLGHGDLRELLL